MADLALRITDAQPSHLAGITAIYAHHVLTGTGSFEEAAPDLAEMERRFSDLRADQFPYLVALDPRGAIMGYAYASHFRQRPAYRFTVEDSIYVAPDQMRQGVGHALMRALILRCRTKGYRHILAVIGDSANAGSIALHAAHGFAGVGLLPGIGYKFGRWIDCVLMHRTLGDGTGSLPT